MPDLNKAFLMGKLTRDPELRYIPGSNSAVCEFGIAINRRFAQADGREKEEACFVEIVVWGKQAETCARFLQKGASVFIEGRLAYEQWTERDTQRKRSRIRVNADRVQFLSPKRTDDGAERASCSAPYGVVPSPSSMPEERRRPYGLSSGEYMEDALEARAMSGAEENPPPVDDLPF